MCGFRMTLPEPGEKMRWKRLARVGPGEVGTVVAKAGTKRLYYLGGE